jgi:hypothetical protein
MLYSIVLRTKQAAFGGIIIVKHSLLVCGARPFHRLLPLRVGRTEETPFSGGYGYP